MNRVEIVGNLTRDPETRATQSGIAVTTFTVAVNRRYTNQQTGQREADYISVVTWRQAAEACAKYLAKGRKVGIVGSLQTRSYETQDGDRRYVTEVIADEVEFLSTARSSPEAGHGCAKPSDQDAPPPAPTQERQTQERMNVYPQGGDEDDDLPF